MVRVYDGKGVRGYECRNGTSVGMVRVYDGTSVGMIRV